MALILGLSCSFSPPLFSGATCWCLPLGSARPRLHLEPVSKGRGCPGDLASSHAQQHFPSHAGPPLPTSTPLCSRTALCPQCVCPCQYQSCLASPLSTALSPHLDSHGHASQAALQGDGTDHLRVSLSRLPQTSHLCTELLKPPFLFQLIPLPLRECR